MMHRIKDTKKVVVMVAPFGATKEQSLWLKNKSAKTGSSQASILRWLIQSRIDEK